MVFSHDTEVALAAAAALVNTDDSDGDHLQTVTDLDELVRTWQWTGPRARTLAEVKTIRALRPTIGAFWRTDKDGAADLVNRVLRESKALPQLVKHDEWDYHLHATPATAPLAERMAVEAAMAMADVVRMDELGRLLTCADGDCRDVFIDLSKNRSRRFCSATCGNRANVAAYRARRR